MSANDNILRRINQLESFAGLILKEATMLKQELSGVVSGNSPKRGEKKSKASTKKAVSNRALKRTRQ